MKKADFTKVFVALVLVFGIFYYLNQNNTFEALKNVSIADFGLLTIITFIGYLTMGLQTYFMLKEQYEIKISLVDVICLPVAMTLFGYIIPTNGGIIYSTLFLKAKYKVKATTGFALGVVLIYISFILSGVFGVIGYFLTDDLGPEIFYISTPLVLSPLLVRLGNQLFQLLPFSKQGFLGIFQSLINELVGSSSDMMKNKKIIFLNVLLTFIYLLITYVSFMKINEMLDLGINTFGLFVLLLTTRVSSLIRVLPGNIGIQELYMGSVFKLVGLTASLGAIFSLMWRFSTIVLMIPFGITHLLLNTHHIKPKEFFNRKGKKSDDI
jgi:hypothetical protein